MNGPIVKFAGRFRITVTGGDGTIKQDTGWFDNLITNQGLDMIGNASIIGGLSGIPKIVTGVCGVGTSSATPAFTDTVLGAQLATHNAFNGTGNFASTTYVPGPPAYWSGLVVYNWSQGAVVGNLTEVGVGLIPNSSTTLYTFSRALILDGSGNPTTLPVIASDTLSVTYELRMYLDLTDHTYSITIGGTGYSGTYRMATVSAPTGYYNNEIDYNFFSPPNVVSYGTGALVPVTSTPTTTLSTTSSGSVSLVTPYAVGTYFASFAGTIPANTGIAINVALILFYTNMGSWQFSVSPTWNRATYQQITVNFNVSWARY